MTSPTPGLQPGDAAPDFTLPRDGGGEISLSAQAPHRVVLYFYPKDDTSGCTIEAQDFTTLAPSFDAAGTTVIGVSKDTVASHDKFVKKHSLGVVLASDADGAVCEEYGVWGEKQMYGKSYMGIERATFLIDGAGKILHIWRKVSAKGHAQEVLDAVKAGA